MYPKSHFWQVQLDPSSTEAQFYTLLVSLSIDTTNKSSGVAISNGVTKMFNDAQGTNDQGSMGIQKKCPSPSVKKEKTFTWVDGLEIP